MNNFLKSIFTFVLVSSSFFIGFYMGQEKIKSKYPEFQEESEESSQSSFS